MPHPTSLAFTERKLSSGDLGLQPLSAARDALLSTTPPPRRSSPRRPALRRASPQREVVRRRSSIRANDVETSTSIVKWRPGHRHRASSDVTGTPAKNVDAGERSSAAVNDAAFKLNAELQRPELVRKSTSRSTVASKSITSGSQSSSTDAFDSPKSILLNRTYFDDYATHSNRPSAPAKPSGHPGRNEADARPETDTEGDISPSTSRRISFSNHHVTPTTTSTVNNITPAPTALGTRISLTPCDIRHYEAASTAYHLAAQQAQHEDLGAQILLPSPDLGGPPTPDFILSSPYPSIPEPKDPARILKKSDLRKQRTFFFSIVLLLNLGALMAAIFAGWTWVFAFILFIKSKDCLSSICSAFGLLIMSVYRLFVEREVVGGKWILTLIPAYSESGEQIVKTIFSLRDNEVAPHKQVMCVILDGKHRDVKKHLTRLIASFKRPYVTSKFKRGELIIDAGFMDDVPVICIEKVRNSGKKDSLILCHDLFNVMRENAPAYTKMLREELWTRLLPTLTGSQNQGQETGGASGEPFRGFDMVFCTDADSTIYPGAAASLANAIARNRNAIAACGLVLVELEPGYKWSRWNLYQQFQYTFGQYVRRRAEGLYGKVTCLPGCITMIAVRPEMAGAIRKYAEPITAYPVILHQVQYLGTDRRLTYSMLSQDKKLKTLFVPEAVSETVAPQSLQHYLSQRRRWGSNAYFNNYFYCFGEKMTPIMRLAASVELVRLTMVYYRIANTVMFVISLTKKVEVMRIIPLLVVSQLPTIWFMFCVFFVEKELRKRCGKLLLGFAINKAVSPFLAVTVFTKVVKNLGSQVWGLTGGANATTAPDPALTGPSSLAMSSAMTSRTSLTSVTSSVLTASTMPGASTTAIVLNEPATTVMMETLVEGALGENMANLPDAELADEESNEKLAGTEEPISPF